MFIPTDEQLKILTSSHRIRIVQACPGSGKTSLFVEHVKRLIENWPYERRGIAALSFTNAASHEIYGRIGESLSFPHFLGTLDSFMLRYVVSPFGPFAGICEDGANLVPAPMDKRLLYPMLKFGSGGADKLPIYSFHLTGGELQSPSFEFRHPIKRKSQILKSDLNGKALNLKRQMWKKSGLITHSDSHFLAAELLASHQHRDLFADVIASRFPIVLVDEFQDTMSYLSIAILALLKSQKVSGLIVGDPDQAIYEFGGARGDIFELAAALPGTSKFSMTLSHRFGCSISKVVSALSHSGTQVQSKPDREPGESILVVHDLDDDRLDSSLIVGLIEELKLTSEIAVLARNIRVVRRLSSKMPTGRFAGTSKLGKVLDDAVFFLRQGENLKASNIVSKELWSFVAGEPEKSFGLPTMHDLQGKGIERRMWKGCIYRIIVEIEKVVENETWNEWLVRAKDSFEKELSEFGLIKKLGSSFKSSAEGNVTRKKIEELQESTTYSTLTVHQAKGAQFENVIVVYSKPNAAYSPCVSSLWWEVQNAEEKKVGFVALSRASSLLVLCVHKQTYNSLRNKRPEFLKLFSRTLAR